MSMIFVCPGGVLQWEDERLRHELKDAVQYAARWLAAEFGMPLEITSIYRSFAEEEGILYAIYKARGYASAELERKAREDAYKSLHPRWRALDARIPNIPPDDVVRLLSEVNQAFPYDPHRIHLKTVLRHVGTADHLHFQVRAA